MWSLRPDGRRRTVLRSILPLAAMTRITQMISYPRHLRRQRPSVADLLPQRERKQGCAGIDCDVLPAVDSITHRAAVDLPAERNFPEQVSGAAVEGKEVT